MYVESRDFCAEVGEFDPASGRLDVYARSERPGDSTLSGHFARVGGEVCVFYRLGEDLWIHVGPDRWRLDERSSVRWVSYGESGSELTITGPSGRSRSIRYRPTHQMYEDDPTPFVEPEHFDLGLFVMNVVNDLGRRRRIYTDEA